MTFLESTPKIVISRHQGTTYVRGKQPALRPTGHPVAFTGASSQGFLLGFKPFKGDFCAPANGGNGELTSERRCERRRSVCVCVVVVFLLFLCSVAALL